MDDLDALKALARGPSGPTAETAGGSTGLTAGNTAAAVPSSRPEWLPPAAVSPTFTYADAPPSAGTSGSGKLVLPLSQATNDPFSVPPGELRIISISDDEYLSAVNNNLVYPGQANPQPVNGQQTNNNDVPPAAATSPNDFEPFDPRLVFISDKYEGNDRRIMSYTADPNFVAPLVEGFVYSKTGARQDSGAPVPLAVQDTNVKKDEIYQDAGNDQFIGVPAMMSNMSYIGLIGSGGKDNVKYLVDRENQPRWYDFTSGQERTDGNGNVVSATQDLTVKGLIEWSQRTGNIKFPYRYQDFVFLKYWKKIPLNYMITLRRYTRPVNDNVTSEFDKDYQGTEKETKLRSAAHAITFLGDEPGNKISSILGPIEAGLKWKEVKADVWQVNTSMEPAQADSPFPNFARNLGFLDKGAEGAKDTRAPLVPPDPYNNGPYANKIIGPVTVIDRVKARDRGIEFKHSINLKFEYVARSIGGVNSKAAMLDILGNLLILTFNSAAFWGGMNRFMPFAAEGAKSPFLGGEAGRRAWIEGNPAKFFDAVSKQFLGAMDNIGDLFNKLFSDPISGLKEIAAGSASNYMKLNTTAARSQVTGMHSLLTGNPVGEWHLTVGNPLNPIMMIGNLICSNIKIEFNDELGPDDFPTEVAATITLEHGMPRDKDAIESMFNKGGGRIYSLPPKMQGYEMFPSGGETVVDEATKQGGTTSNKKGSGGRGNKTASSSGTPYKEGNPLLGDETQVDQIVNTFRNSTAPGVANVSIAVYNHGMAAYNQTNEKSGQQKTS